MPTIKHPVILNRDEREFLEKYIKSGDWTPRVVTRAKILLLADVNGPDMLTDEKIVAQIGCSLPTVFTRRKRFSLTRSLEDSLFDKARSGRPTIINGAVDAHMTAIACSTTPEGFADWTLRLIKDKLISLEIVETISHSTVGRILKKKKSSLG